MESFANFTEDSLEDDLYPVILHFDDAHLG